MRPLLLAAAAVASLALAPVAEAAITIKANGVTVASDPTNLNATFVGAVGGFNINVINSAGVNAFAGNGTLMENASVNIATAGTGTLTLELIQTDLSLPGATAEFSALFTGLITNAAVSRAFYIDTANTGAAATLLGATAVGNESFSTAVALSGLFSLTEVITITANGPGAALSADDQVRVPEPMSLALLGLGIVGLAVVRRRAD